MVRREFQYFLYRSHVYEKFLNSQNLMLSKYGSKSYFPNFFVKILNSEFNLKNVTSFIACMQEVLQKDSH